MSRTRGGRPSTGQIPLQHTRIPQKDWDDLGEVAEPGRAEVVRDLVAWYLRRPGARLPTRPTPEQVAALGRD